MFCQKFASMNRCNMSKFRVSSTGLADTNEKSVIFIDTLNLSAIISYWNQWNQVTMWLNGAEIPPLKLNGKRPNGLVL